MVDLGRHLEHNTRKATRGRDISRIALLEENRETLWAMPAKVSAEVLYAMLTLQDRAE